MARIPTDELERLKTDISIVRLVTYAGIELKQSGKDLIGLCPFHDEKTPSLVISESKNVFHCFGCNASGTVIDWVMKTEGVSFRYAVELLRDRLAGGGAWTTPPTFVKRTRVQKLDVPFKLDSEDQTLLNQVIDFYHQTLLENEDALAYLEKRGISNLDIVKRFKLGYANRTLAYRLPAKQYKAGKQLRTQLQTLGLLRSSGHEHFNGSLIIPVLDSDHNVVEAYGRKIRDDLRKGTPKHLYLPGEHKGVFNLDGFMSRDGRYADAPGDSASANNQKEIILCEALIDALTFYQAGYTNVTSSYGTNGFTNEMLAFFKQWAASESDLSRHTSIPGGKRVLIAYDRDDAGNSAAMLLAKRLMQEGIDCYRINFPKGMDANSYALSMQLRDDVQGSTSVAGDRKSRATKSLGVAINSAEWMGEGKKELSVRRELSEKEASPIQAQAVPDKADSIDADVAEHEVSLNFGERRYRVRGIEKNLSYEVLKINLLASQKDLVHVDTFDLYNARHRLTFIKQAAVELDIDEAIIKKDVGKVLLKLELMQEEKIEDRLNPKDGGIAISEDDQQQALELLKSPDLLNTLLNDFNRCGVVGEETNKLAGYLACVSRKLDAPLAIIVQSTSAAGKSSLMDAVLNLMPIEDKVQYAAMTGQSLFYMGETDLKHKILAIVEEEGAHQASYALKLLQSEGELTIASTGKDPQTGRLETQEYRVEGPVMLFLTTTAIEIDDELLNRCLVLTVNEDREQTKAIHQLQRKKRTLEGLLEKENKKAILNLHRNAQRLLKPLHVVNPYAEQLTFLDDRTRTRRDHEKYLTLIDSIALLHQYQRKQHTVQRGEDTLTYIEVTLDDIRVANELAHDILGRTLDELPPQTRRLLKLIYAMVKVQCDEQCLKASDVRFSRREVREYAGWSEFQVKVHIKKLEDMEYVLIHRGGRGQSFVYELLYSGEGEQGDTFLMGLIDVKRLTHDYDANQEHVKIKKEPSSSPQSAPKLASSRSKKNGKTKTETSTYALDHQNAEKSTYTAQEKTGS